MINALKQSLDKVLLTPSKLLKMSLLYDHANKYLSCNQQSCIMLSGNKNRNRVMSLLLSLCSLLMITTNQKEK